MTVQSRPFGAEFLIGRRGTEHHRPMLGGGSCHRWRGRRSRLSGQDARRPTREVKRQAVLLRRGELVVDRLEGVQAGAVPGEAQGVLACAIEHPGRHAHQLLDNGAQPPPFGAMAHRGVFAEQATQSDPAQDVVGQGRDREHQVVGV